MQFRVWMSFMLLQVDGPRQEIVLGCKSRHDGEKLHEPNMENGCQEGGCGMDPYVPRG